MATHPDSAIAGDAAWLAHRYDPIADAVHFVEVPRTAHRAVPFLTDEYLPAAVKPRVVSRRSALAAAPPPGPLHFIFHSAYCCSTLLANAFDLEGVSIGLKEPVILNDLSGWKQRGGDPARIAEALDSAMALLARPFQPGEAVIVKPSNLINPFANAMLAMRPASRALFLYAPLRLYLGSIAKKGMWGRLWVRELFVKLSRDGITDYGHSVEDLLGLTDLQLAAIGWLAQHRLFTALIDLYGSTRIRTLDSEQLLAHPAKAIAALARFYGLEIGAAAAARIAGGDAFSRHSKDGSEFGREQRLAQQRDAAAVHAEEIEMVAVWAEAVAENAGQALKLPAPLLD